MTDPFLFHFRTKRSSTASNAREDPDLDHEKERVNSGEIEVRRTRGGKAVCGEKNLLMSSKPLRVLVKTS